MIAPSLGILVRRLRQSPGKAVALVVKSCVCTPWLRLRGVRCGFVSCQGRPPRIRGGGTVRLGRLALRGSRLPVEIGATAAGHLVIGDRTLISQGASAVTSLNIEIGCDVRIGDLVAIYDTDRHPLDQTSRTRAVAVHIGDNVWLDRGALVLPGVVTRDHAVVAAGSVLDFRRWSGDACGR